MSVKRDVMRTDKSPLNPKQWCLQLSCGHDVWVTAARKPTAKTAQCERCGGGGPGGSVG